MSKVIEMKFTAADLDKLPTPTREEGRQRYKDTHPKANGLRLDVLPLVGSRSIATLRCMERPKRR